MFLAYLRKLKGTRFSCVGGGLRLGSAIWPAMKLVRAGKAEPLCSSMSRLKRWTRSGATPPNLLLSTIGRVPARPRPRREMATVRRAELDVALLLSVGHGSAGMFDDQLLEVAEEVDGVVGLFG